MFQNFSINFTKNIRRRVITNKFSYLNNQMRLTNIQLKAKPPTRFTYRIEYTTSNKKGGMNFIHHLISEK